MLGLLFAIPSEKRGGCPKALSLSLSIYIYMYMYIIIDIYIYTYMYIYMQYIHAQARRWQLERAPQAFELQPGWELSDLSRRSECLS